MHRDPIASKLVREIRSFAADIPGAPSRELFRSLLDELASRVRILENRAEHLRVLEGFDVRVVSVEAGEAPIPYVLTRKGGAF